MASRDALSAEDWAFWDTWMQAQRLLAKEVERVLQRDYGISKAEFSILTTLHATAGGSLRVTDLADSLDWEKGRVAHQLSRMERRGLLERIEAGAAGRRTGVALTRSGKEVARRAIRGHGANLRRLAFDRLAPEQAEAIYTWSNDLIRRFGPASAGASGPDGG